MRPSKPVGQRKRMAAPAGKTAKPSLVEENERLRRALARQRERRRTAEQARGVGTAPARAADSVGEQQAATVEILHLIATSPGDEQPVFDAIARHALRICKAKGAVVARYDGVRLHLAAHHNVDPEAVARLASGFPRVPDGSNAVDRAVLDGVIVHFPDLQAAVEYSGSVARQFGARSQVQIPLLHEGRAIGAIGVSRQVLGPFPEQEIALLQTFAAQAVIAIQNARLFRELGEKNRALTAANARVTETLEQQTATAEIVRVISASPTDIEPVLDTVARTAARLCDAVDASIHRLDGDRLRIAAHFGPIPLARGRAGRRVVAGSRVGDRPRRPRRPKHPRPGPGLGGGISPRV
jgi:two-component system, NtrC family, sensor kinase